MGDDIQISLKGKGTIHLKHGSFQNVMYVPYLDSNLLSMYQMTHTSFPRKVVFNHTNVEIYEITNGNLIETGKENHVAKTYEFSVFLPYSKPSSLLNHGN